jgi:hypothetical protein
MPLAGFLAKTFPFDDDVPPTKAKVVVARNILNG